MAMQAGLGVSRILFVIGAGYTGTILLKTGNLSDALTELQALLKGNGKDGEAEGNSDAVTAQIRRLAMEVRQLASARPIILNGGSWQDGLTTFVVPAATLGALGYVYMWWKGYKFSDLMYVTKQNMANAVSNLTKHLEHVKETVAAAKSHLTQRIEKLDGKVEDQVELSKLIRNEITGARGDLSRIDCSLEELERRVSSLGGRMDMLGDKQNVANTGVLYLCGLVHGKKMELPERIQEEINAIGNSVPSIMGLKEVAGALEPGSNNGRFITDGISGDGIDNISDKPRNVWRRFSTKA